MPSASPPIPVLDIAEARTADASPALLRDLDAACRTTGFLQVIGHGIPLEVFADVYETGIPVCRLPGAELPALTSEHPFRGLVVQKDDNDDRLVERFQANRFEDAADASRAGVPADYLDWFVPNLWPSAAPDFETAFRRCFAATRQLGQMLMRLCAKALSAPTELFTFPLDVSYLALCNYPAASSPAGEIRVEEHSDSGLLTMLHQRGDHEGLEIRTLAGDIVSVPALPEAIVVNIGDLLARLTNDEWRATPHRVVSGPPGCSRTSIAAHFLPHVDTLIQPLPGYGTKDPARYSPVTPYTAEARYFARRSRVLRIEDGADEAVGVST